MSRNRRTILVPLATLVAAGAIAVGSGATFTSQSGNTASSVVSGTLTHSNSKDNAAIFALTDLKPGDTLNGSLTLTNTGSLPAAFSLTETASSNAFSSNLLNLAITDTTTSTTVYDGTFGGLTDGEATPLGTFAANEAHSYRFTVTLAQAATNTEQGKGASATFQWNSIQLDGTTTNQ
ncbi:TasA family protein [Nocardioides cavernaquae]|uniref:Camelysin-like metallo-endopeptidase n=1 Tax=Nocardioides cavernaquae TaxID=2321396 RepID=A0A3A5H8T6_9ACTN|nr:TasA family protein [Nocardioides cavernaquae]RJS46268.1 hypothetical protein D4739_08620 [Nocardioides cavernaquae]